jgi:hypothetical protein
MGNYNIVTIQPLQFAYLVVAPALTLLSIDKTINLLYGKILGSEAKTPSWLMWMSSPPGLLLAGVSILCLGGIPVFVIQGIVVRHVALSREVLLGKFLWAWAHVGVYTLYKMWKMNDHCTREMESNRTPMARCMEEREALLTWLRNHPLLDSANDA